MDKRSITTLAAVILLLAFAFAYKIDGLITLQNWFTNFIIILFLVTIAVFAHYFAQLKLAEHYLIAVESRIFAFGAILTLVLMFLSGGVLIYAAPFTLGMNAGKSTGRDMAAGPYYKAKIALAGVITSIALAVVGKLLAVYIGDIAEKFIFINISLAISSLIPLITVIPAVKLFVIPGGTVDVQYATGDHIFFGSRPLWLFSFVFVTAFGLGLIIFDALYLWIALSFALASSAWLSWLYFFEGFKPKP